MHIEWRDMTDAVGEPCWSPYGDGVAEGAFVKYFPDAAIITFQERWKSCDDHGLARFTCSSFDDAEFFVSNLIKVETI
jgi:hypothetical protein